MSEKLTLFDLFGGTRKMADALDEPPSTVQSWKSAGRIPAFKQPDVLAKAQELGLDVSAEDIIFPLGRDDTPDDCSASATKCAGNIRSAETPADKFAENIREGGQPIEGKGEADSLSPFSMASPSTCSATGERQNMPAASPSCSSSRSKAA